MHDRGVAGAPNEIVVGADDRTGALETAGAIADAVGEPVTVVTDVSDLYHSQARANVVDVASRHESADVAAARAAALEFAGAGAHLHKIDSTLRGNWAHELVARHRESGRPVLLVPALPALGRTCVGGVVLVHGRPVHEGATGADARGGPSASRPAALLGAAGAGDVAELTHDDAVAAWFERPTGMAVADAATDEDLARIGHRWSRRVDVLLAGTSAMLAAGASGGARQRRERPTLAAERVLIVSGSLHPGARQQIERVVAAGANRVHGTPPDRHGVVVVESDMVPTPVDSAAAARAAVVLAMTAEHVIATWHPDAVVVLGGDTTAALLGDGPVTVRGTLAPGAAWARIDGCIVVTRAGGFGDETALADLVWGTLSP